MTQVVPLTKQELASKLVQEIAKKGDEIPEEYLRKDGFPEAIDAPDLWRGKLLIDFSLLSSYSATELAKLRSALSQWGCFQVIPLSFYELIHQDFNLYFHSNSLVLVKKFVQRGSLIMLSFKYMLSFNSSTTRRLLY